MLSFLPASLLALVFASPIFATPTSPNDPFHEIATRAPKLPEPPVCCLRPLPPLETPTDEELLLSFEDWKAKRFSEARQTQPTPGTHPPLASGQKSGSSTVSDVVSEPPGADAAVSSQQGPLTDNPILESEDTSRLSPHFRIPIVDRFNYASLDCSARVHTAHRSAKSPASILSSKKDKYMLSPCAEAKQFVVVELCEDIRVDTVQLANFEFFSGVFKDFSVSVAKTYTTDTDGWTVAGTYRAKNVRGVQSFHLPPHLRDFYRFIRIDFHSHYGNEYYCPVSLLRVYGLTHLEEWKWETWEQESRARRVVEEINAPSEVTIESPQVVHVPVVEPPEAAETAVAESMTSTDPSHIAEESTASLASSVSLTSLTEMPPPAASESQLDPDTTISTESADMQTTGNRLLSAATKGLSTYTTTQDHDSTHHETTRATHSDHTTDSVYIYSPTTSPSVSLSSPTSSSPESSLLSSPTSSASVEPSSNVSSSLSEQATRSSQPQPASSSAPATLSPVPLPPPAPPVTTGGESIYRTIMNRLTALEANTTLYARYVEEQTAGVREVIRRLGEDVGRLEGIGKAQAQMYQRSILEFDRQWRRLELEHSELLLKVNRLTDEVILEKRLGIAQLCLLLAIIVFMVMTRGSRGEPVHVRLAKPSAMRDWGRRTLSFSGELVNKFRSRSPTPQPREMADVKLEPNPLHTFEFPPQSHPDSKHLRNRPSQTGSSAPRRSIVRPRTPSALRLTPTSRHFNLYGRAATSGGLHSPTRSISRPQIQRASSGSAASGFVPLPRSGKRWARTAHLHEVRSTGVVPTTSRLEHDENVVDLGGGLVLDSRPRFEDSAITLEDAGDVFSSARALQKDNATPKGKERVRAVGRPPLSPLRLPGANELSLGCSRARSASDAASDGDGWVDTDVDASESEPGTSAAHALKS
ncbi:hypothetical protein CERSUDRAFT_150222 [Gelatoporia subvermispora B]|uniref:SUN domain-containing protein n=1 Tax=Ceriporiopsis subvermispora (strain B) TaxID=914234 RepID=M2R4W6_CERS8|nr:hypothetical protein CERSUDRAFT_150222 [Gelatoporia subvermispora B]